MVNDIETVANVTSLEIGAFMRHSVKRRCCSLKAACKFALAIAANRFEFWTYNFLTKPNDSQKVKMSKMWTLAELQPTNPNQPSVLSPRNILLLPHYTIT